MSRTNQQHSTGGRAYPDALDGTVGGALDAGGNDATHVDAAEINQRIQAAHARICEWEEERRALNAKISAEMALLEKYGVNKHALRQARRFILADEKQRQGLDQSYRICRTALGVPVQDELPLHPPARH